MTSFALRSLPKEERPRERLIRDGADALSIPELLAIVLGSGMQGKSVLALSEEILVRFGSLEKLLNASIAELKQIKGIGPAKAIQLKAVLAIAQKCRKPASLERICVQSAQDAYAIIKEEICHHTQEVLLVLLRDVRGCLIHLEKVSMGTLTEVLVHPREVFYPAIRNKAHSMILAHNHPSGDPTPSAADLQLTHLLLHSSKVMGIGLDDHLIVCPHAFVSLRERGILGRGGRY